MRDSVDELHLHEALQVSLHPIHLIAFALDPRYARLCAAAPSVLRTWIKKLHNNSADDTKLVNDYGADR